MLKPALLYKEELQKKYIEHWYDDSTNYYNGGVSRTLTISDTNMENLEFASVDSNGNVIGFIACSWEWSSRAASQFGIISFEKGNLEFVRDLYRFADLLFNKYQADRIEWFSFKSNPTNKAYQRFITRFGGGIVGVLHRNIRLRNGKTDSTYIYEILRDEFHFEKFNRYFKRVVKNRSEGLAANNDASNEKRIGVISDEETIKAIRDYFNIGYDGSNYYMLTKNKAIMEEDDDE